MSIDRAVRDAGDDVGQVIMPLRSIVAEVEKTGA
jgi:hypothetical protein